MVFARATGEVGVVLVTSGGATNAITSIGRRLMDSAPAGDSFRPVATSLIGYDAFRECDMVGISRPVVKHSLVKGKPKIFPAY